MESTAGRTSHAVDLEELRFAGGVMLAAAALLPLLPGDAGLPCPLRTLTGTPCPLCGMTTSVTAATRLRLGEAVAANPAGLVAVVLAVALLVMRPRGVVALPAWLVATALAAMWVFQLARFSTA